MLLNRKILRKDKRYQQLKNKTCYTTKMAHSLFSYFCTLVLILEIASVTQTLSGVRASIVSVDSNGAYNKLTVKITDHVPRQLCQQTLDTLEVRLSDK